MIRVTIADDQEVVRMGLRVMLDREPDLQVVGEAANGQEALAVVRRTRPDVALLDVRMPGLTGLDALDAVRADPELEHTRVIVLTTFELDEYVFRALRAGASGFLVKDTPPHELVQAIRTVAAGDSLLSPSVTRKVIEAFGRSPVTDGAPLPAFDQLTERERELVAWVATGLSNQEIGERLYISPATVRTHIGRAMLKLHARDRAQLVVFAVRAGLAIPGETR